jgi:hypothetical protein
LAGDHWHLHIPRSFHLLFLSEEGGKEKLV